jgi:hypothetical protein
MGLSENYHRVMNTPIRRVLKERTEKFADVLSGKLLVELTTCQLILNPEDTMN